MVHVHQVKPRKGVAMRMGMRLGAILAVASLLLPGLANAGSAARAARTITLSETGRLRLTSHRGFTLNEVGSASGAIRGTIYLHLNIVSTNRVTAEVNIYPSTGSLTGRAAAGYHVNGGTASFSGTMAIARGTGSFARAHGTGLGFVGSIRRSNDAVTVYLTGRLSD